MVGILILPICVIVLFAQGNIHLLFHSSGNHYMWSKVTSTVHNIIVGKLWIDQVRSMCPRSDRQERNPFHARPRNHCRGVLCGHMFPVFQQSGDIDIVNITTKDTCRLKFSPYSYFSREVPRKVSLL